MFSFGLFPGVYILNVNFSEHTVCSIFIGESYRLAYEDGTTQTKTYNTFTEQESAVVAHFFTEIWTENVKKDEIKQHSVY
jgi:hypothetical protein